MLTSTAEASGTPAIEGERLAAGVAGGVAFLVEVIGRVGSSSSGASVTRRSGGTLRAIKGAIKSNQGSVGDEEVRRHLESDQLGEAIVFVGRLDQHRQRLA